MKVLGTLTAALLTAALVGAVVLGVRSVPDVKRYLAIRRM
ncbi:MAG: hypothetical protein JWP46_2091 [Modestobacter sp.]|nr:hypothetical protein [Modestobacter sp.]